LEWAWIVRLLVLASAAALVLCMLRLMPRRRLPLISTLGAGGFTIYLLHPLVILPARELGWIARVNTPLEIVGLVLCAILLTMLLGSPPVRRLARPLTRPSAGWLFAPAAPGPQRQKERERPSGDVPPTPPPGPSVTEPVRTP
nr:hypothetical protein [Streptomyces sp. DSM 41633]